MTDTSKMREEFEAKFPVPAGVAWKESIGMYEVVDVWKLDKPITIGRYNWLWEGWQASRQAVVVELPQPEPFDVDCDESLEMEPEEYEALEAAHGARWSEHSRLKKAIEAQGLRCEVKP